MLNEKMRNCLENTIYEHHDVIRLNFVKSEQFKSVTSSLHFLLKGSRLIKAGNSYFDLKRREKWKRTVSMVQWVASSSVDRGFDH